MGPFVFAKDQSVLLLSESSVEDLIVHDGSPARGALQ